MIRNILRALLVAVLSACSGGLLFQDACGGGYSSDCIGADGYNWCIPGGGWDEIHSPSVEPMDFSPYGYD